MGYDPFKDLPYRRESVDDPAPFVPATEKQTTYIQILTNDLNFTEHSRDAHIADILKRPFRWVDGSLSKGDASNVIQQFKAWKEELQSRARKSVHR